MLNRIIGIKRCCNKHVDCRTCPIHSNFTFIEKRVLCGLRLFSYSDVKKLDKILSEADDYEH